MDKTAVLPVSRAKGRWYSPRTGLYCVVGAQERKAARSGECCSRFIDVVDDIYKATDVSLIDVNDRVNYGDVRLTPTERTMLLAFLLQAADYRVIAVER